jgi:hypothetical protein
MKLSLTLGEKYRMKLFGSSVLIIIFENKGDGVQRIEKITQ